MEPKSSWQPGPAVCRCCLTEGCYKDISSEYFWMGKREVYADMLSETLDVNISYTTSGGRLICESCISRLRDATEFKKQVLDCEKTFIQLLQPNESGITSFDDDNPSGIMSVEPGVSKQPVKAEIVMKMEKDDSDDDFPDMSHTFDDDDDDELDVPLKNFATKIPKEEPDTEILDLLKRPGITAKRISTTKAKTTPAKKAKVTVKAKDKPSSSKPAVKLVAKTATKKTVVKPAKDEKKKKEVEHGNTESMVNAQIIISNTTALPFRAGDRTKIRCVFCICEFDDPAEFRAHMDTKHNKLDLGLVISKLPKYGTTRVDIHNLKCKHCAKPADKIETLATHLNEKHGFNIDTQKIDLVPIDLVKNVFVCLFCDRKFSGLHYLCRHSGTHLSKHICNICGRHYETSHGLNEHTTKKHVEDRKYFCRYCTTSFPSFITLKEHRIENVDCNPVRCKVCNEKFLTYKARNKHSIEQHGKKKVIYPCLECGKVFDERDHFDSHYANEHRERIKCPHCEQTFKCQSSLLEHSFRHTGERPFKCTDCDKAFSGRHNLKRHMAMHNEELKSMCNVCGRRFRELYDLKRHTRSHHPEVQL